MKAAYALSDRETARDAAGESRACAACGRPPAELNPLVIAESGHRIHLRHFTNPESGFHGKPHSEEHS